MSTNPNASLDPFATYHGLDAAFRTFLADRQLRHLHDWLDQQEQAKPEADLQRLLAYWRAIAFVENNQWDEGQRILLPLLRNGLHPHLHMRVANVLAIASEHLGLLTDAFAQYTKAMQLAEHTNDWAFWAKVVKNRMICTIRLYESGQIPAAQLITARQDLEKAITINVDCLNQQEEGQCWNELGASYKATHQWQQAIACYKKELYLCQATADRHGIAAASNNIGEVLAAQQHYREAESWLTTAVELFAAENDPYEEADALANLGRALAGQGKLAAAQSAFDQAIRCVESVRREIRTTLARSDFFATQMPIYGAKIAHALQQGEVATAFNCTEQARSRGLLDLLADATIRPPQTLAPALVEQERLLRSQWQAVADQAAPDTLVAEQRLHEFYRELHLLAPDYAALRSALPLTAEQILAHLPTDTAICAYFGLPEQLVCFLLTQKRGVTAIRLPMTVRQVASAALDGAGRLRSLLPTAAGDLSEPWLLTKLHDALIAPLLPHLADCQRLVLLPHGALHRLPLHAAYDPVTQQFLCDRFAILYAPSATIQCTRLLPKAMATPHAGVLAVAPGAVDLTHPPAEARAIARLLDGAALIGPAATTTQVLQQAPHYRYLHIAGHAHYRADAPLLSSIALADQHLTAWDLLQSANVGCALVSINGCESGVNLVQSGDELMGLARALLYAVAPSVLLTLWPIHDLAARVFAQLFYQQIQRQPMPVEQALAHCLRLTVAHFRHLSTDAVRALLRADDLTPAAIDAALAQLPSQGRHTTVNPNASPFAHPYFWAPYLLIGEVWADGASRQG